MPSDSMLELSPRRESGNDAGNFGRRSSEMNCVNCECVLDV